MTPHDYYTKLLNSDQILPDPQQTNVITQLQGIYEQLMARASATFLSKLSPKQIKGLYLWGDVGVGKTFLMDILYYCIPGTKKWRVHFHKFMQEIHHRLQQYQGRSNPLRLIAKEIARDIHIICFDELAVVDIADAMILAELFQALYAEKICLIFTSNTSPDELYKNGLQRGRFVPAIKLIEEHSNIIHMTNTDDYRLTHQSSHPYYFYPLSANTEQKLAQLFSSLSHEQPVQDQPLVINDRQIAIQKQAAGVLWVEFKQICGKPRCQLDYLVLVETFHTFIISDLTMIQKDQHDLIRTFINLIDVLYDAKRKLIISATVPVEQIYPAGKMLGEFARTKSRLIEMRTQEWHDKSPLPLAGEG